MFKWKACCVFDAPRRCIFSRPFLVPTKPRNHTTLWPRFITAENRPGRLLDPVLPSSHRRDLLGELPEALFERGKPFRASARVVQSENGENEVGPMPGDIPVESSGRGAQIAAANPPR